MTLLKKYCTPQVCRKFAIPLKNILDYRTADMFFTERQTGLPAEKSRGDMFLRRGRDELLKKREITQEERLQYIPVDPSQHCPIVRLCGHGQHALDVPQGLKQVEHVVSMVVEKFTHK